MAMVIQVGTASTMEEGNLLLCNHRSKIWETISVSNYIAGSSKSLAKIQYGLASMGINLETFLRAKMGSGSSVRLWLDNWAEPAPSTSYSHNSLLLKAIKAL
jgi:hypothetical protein